MNNWEEKYGSYKNGADKARYTELEEKGTSRNREEQDEFKKMGKIMNNLVKVENIMDYKEKLDNNLEILKAEISLREGANNKEETRAKLESELEKIEFEMEKISKRVKEINEKINNSETSAYEKVELESEKVMLTDKQDLLKVYKNQNQIKFAENESTKNEGNPEFKNISTEDLRKQCFEIGSQLSKSNMVANNLMNGLSRASIEKKLEGWQDRKFTSKTPLPLTNKERKMLKENTGNKDIKNKEVEVKEEENKEIDVEEKDLRGIDVLASTGENIKSGFIPATEKLGIDTEKMPALVDEFAKKHPKLAKIRDGFKNIMNKISGNKKENVSKEEKTLETESNNAEVKGQAEDKPVTAKDRNKEFRKSLHEYDILEVAEKGVDGMKTGKEELQAKRAEFQNAAHERETKKFGKAYADKSVINHKEKDDDEISL